VVGHPQENINSVDCRGEISKERERSSKGRVAIFRRRTARRGLFVKLKKGITECSVSADRWTCATQWGEKSTGGPEKKVSADKVSLETKKKEGREKKELGQLNS